MSKLAASLAPLGRAGTDHGVQFVNEQHDIATGIFYFAQDRFETFFELATKLGAGDQRAHIQGNNAFVLEALRYVAFHDAQGQSFDDGRFANARFADQYRIVLGARARELG